MTLQEFLEAKGLRPHGESSEWPFGFVMVDDTTAAFPVASQDGASTSTLMMADPDGAEWPARWADVEASLRDMGVQTPGDAPPEPAVKRKK
jgi:hypothetical protein